MKRIAALIGVTVALVAPSVTFAAGSATCQGYNPQTCSSLGRGSVSANTTGGLPFTGLDLVLLIAGAVTLLGAGYVLRSFSRRLD